MAEHQTDRDLEFIDLFDSDTPDARKAAILAKLRESPEDYQRYEAYLEILNVPVARKKDPPVHVHNDLLAAANQHIKEQRRMQVRAWFSWLTHPALAGVAVLCGAFFLGQEFMSLGPGKPEEEIQRSVNEDSLTTAKDNPIKVLEALPEAEPTVETALDEPLEKAAPEMVARSSDRTGQPARSPLSKPLPERDALANVHQISRKATTGASAKLGQRGKMRTKGLRPQRKKASGARSTLRNGSPSVKENPLGIAKVSRRGKVRSQDEQHRPLRKESKLVPQREGSLDRAESELMIGSADKTMMAVSPTKGESSEPVVAPQPMKSKAPLMLMAEVADEPQIGAGPRQPFLDFGGNLEGFLSLIDSGNPIQSFTSKTLIRQARLSIGAKRFKFARRCATIVLDRRDTFQTEAQAILDTLPK